MLMRRRLLELLRQRGEEEVTRAVPAVSLPTTPAFAKACAAYHCRPACRNPPYRSVVYVSS